MVYLYQTLLLAPLACIKKKGSYSSPYFKRYGNTSREFCGKRISHISKPLGEEFVVLHKADNYYDCPYIRVAITAKNIHRFFI